MDGLPPIAEEVQSLVRALGSAEAIELLLVLRVEKTRSFSARDLAVALHVSRSVEPTLERLASLNVLDVHVRGELRYRYAPGSPELERAVTALEREYAARRLAVLDIFRSRSPIGAFADAFRLRGRNKPDG